MSGLTTKTKKSSNSFKTVHQNWMLVNKKEEAAEVHYGGGVQLEIESVLDTEGRFRFLRVYGLPTTVIDQMKDVDKYSLVCVGTEQIWIYPNVTRSWDRTGDSRYLITSPIDKTSDTHMVTATLEKPLGYLELPVVD